ncbi:MAG TPA: response regulator [Polyangiaceae bacterium]
MLRVFLVDDDDNNRLTLSVLLEEDGFDVAVAASFGEALSVLESEVTFDLFLLDHSLGDGIGADLIPLIRTRFPQAKVVTISGSLGSESASAAADLAVAKALHFPILAEKLRALARH